MNRGFNRNLLPEPAVYYAGELQGLKTRYERATSKCPFHGDDHPSFSVNLLTGAYNCFSCGERGKDVLDFQKRRYCQTFQEAAKAIGAWS
jgi:putative DNA primase/helicase